MTLRKKLIKKALEKGKEGAEALAKNVKETGIKKTAELMKKDPAKVEADVKKTTDTAKELAKEATTVGKKYAMGTVDFVSQILGYENFDKLRKEELEPRVEKIRNSRAKHLAYLVMGESEKETLIPVYKSVPSLYKGKVEAVDVLCFPVTGKDYQDELIGKVTEYAGGTGIKFAVITRTGEDNVYVKLYKMRGGEK